MRKPIVYLCVSLAVVTGTLSLVGALLYEPDRSPRSLLRDWGLPSSRMVDVAGMRVHVAVEGSGTPLVLLHGTGASLHAWNGWSEALSGQFLVVRPDLPGFGITGPHPGDDYTIAAYVDFLHALAVELGLERFHLAGNSLGGRIAWNYAASYPDRVSRLILIDASGYPRDGEPPLVFRLARIPALGSVLSRMTPRSIFRASLEEVFADDTLVDETRVQRYFELALRDGNREAFLHRARTADDRSDPADRLGAIRAPTLIQWGAQDAWIPLADGRRFARDIPDAELIVYPALGHVPMEEAPAVTARDALRFLLGDQGGSALRAEECPQHEPEHGQEQYDDDPHHLAAGGCIAAQDLHDGVDIQYQYDQPEQAADFHSHISPPQ